MLRFACVDPALLSEDGLPGTGPCFDTLAEARSAQPGAAVVVLEEGRPKNLDPYLPPKEVVAGGGYLVRGGEGEPEVLLIFRKGKWDLPKGKQDPGESIATCALREVREEVGIERLALGEPVGQTVHTYEESGHLVVKPTHWYLMTTPEDRFVPAREEGITEVVWVPWREAHGRLGYTTLQRHMRGITLEAVRRHTRGEAPLGS